MAEELLNAIIDGSLNYEVIIQAIKAGKLPELDVNISSNKTHDEIDVITDFVPHFINFVKSKLSSCLTPHQLASCSPKRPPPFKRGKHRSETKPAKRGSLFVKNGNSDATSKSHNVSKDHSKSVDSYLSGRSKQVAGKHAKQQNTQSRKPRRIALNPNNESEFLKSPFDEASVENKINGGEQMKSAQQGKKQEKRRITPTLLTPTTEPLQENEKAKHLFETSSVFETPESSVDSDGSPSYATPFDKKMKKLERTMRGKRRTDSAKMPLSAFLSSDDKFEDGTEAQTSIIGTPVKPLTPNVNKSCTQRLTSSPISVGEIKKAKPALSKILLSCDAPQREHELHFTEDSLQDKHRLNAFAEIYKCILLENLASNITVELYFLFSVLNCKLEKESQDLCDEVIFESKESCIYFSAKVLSGAKSLLAILDKRALRMISENKRLLVLAPELIVIIQEKLSEELNTSSASSMKSFNFSTSLGVPFQMENNRKAFLSDRYFYSFSKMRDKFYRLVRIWEENHLDNDWNIEMELGEQFQSFFHDYEEFPTYHQFSQLFVAQLIEMSSQDFSGMFSRDEGTSTSLLSYLKNTNPAKFQLLQERFVMPLISEGPCPKPSFTDVEKFFKVFIDRSSNYGFITHLKNTLIVRLLEINMGNVSWNIHLDESADENDNFSAARNDISIRLSEARILAKLLGYIVFLPYVADSLSRKAPDDCSGKALVIQPFEPNNILTEAVKNHHLIVTVPWLVIYLSMMDRISLKSQINREVFQNLAAIYRSQNLRLQQRDLSYDKLFILIQLGWLFEQPVIVEGLPFYKMLASNDLPKVLPLENGKRLDMQPIITKAMMIRFCPYLTEFRMVLTNVGVSSVRKITPLTHKEKIPIADTNDQLKEKMIEDFFKYKPKYFKESTDFVTERFCSNLKHEANTDKVPKFIKNAITSLEGNVEFNDGEKLELDSMKQKNNAIFMKQTSIAKAELTTEMKSTCDEYCNKNASDVVSKLLPADVDKRVTETAANIVSYDVKKKLNEWVKQKLLDFFENELKAAYNRLLMSILKKNNKSFAAEL
eukprot:Seg1674.3 transcript_id=Seg1674.3/GoldUCD/mRNA.D3Y31 product=Codanin-1 protein_id=Seg1674.3/GoldUCD/D3Y31